MKQLLLYFTFFIASSLILVQCAKLFPSTDKTPGIQTPTTLKVQKAKYNRAAKKIENETIKVNRVSMFQSNTIIPFLYNSYLPYKIILKFKNSRRLYNQYIFQKQHSVTENYTELLSRNSQLQ